MIAKQAERPSLGLVFLNLKIALHRRAQAAAIVVSCRLFRLESNAMSPLFRRIPLSVVLLGLALVGIGFCYEVSERGGSRWQSVPVVCFSPDGKSLAAGMYNGRFIYAKGTYYMADLCATTAVVLPGAETPPIIVDQHLTPGLWNGLPEIAIGRFVDWSPDGQWIAVGSAFLRATEETPFPGAVRLYSAAEFKQVHEVATNLPQVHSLAFDPGTKTLATSFRYWVQLRDPKQPEKMRQLELGANVAGFAFSPTAR
jgi:hypothetical protein